MIFPIEYFVNKNEYFASSPIVYVVYHVFIEFNVTVYFLVHKEFAELIGGAEIRVFFVIREVEGGMACFSRVSGLFVESFDVRHQIHGLHFGIVDRRVVGKLRTAAVADVPNEIEQQRFQLLCFIKHVEYVYPVVLSESREAFILVNFGDISFVRIERH